MEMLKTEKFHLKIQIASYEIWEEVVTVGPCSCTVMEATS